MNEIRTIKEKMRAGRGPAWTVCKFLLAVGVVAWLIFENSGNLGYNWQWYRVPQYLFKTVGGEITAGPLMKGLLVTFKIAGISLVLAFAVGLATAILRLSGSFLGRLLSRAYLEIVRNTPLLVQIFFIYFVLGRVLDVERFTAAVLALSLFEGAYASEIFRAGILSIDAGQWEASRSLGMTRYETYRHVILPQAITRILPTLASQAVSLIKDSALVSTIAIYDLTMQGQIIIAETYLTFELWFTIAAIYLTVNATLSLGVLMMERRLNSGSSGL